jgi:hypothetical protein
MQYDILKNKSYEITEKIRKEQKFKDYERKLFILETNFRKERKIYGACRNDWRRNKSMIFVQG